MLYLIGLGLNEKGISKQGLEAIKKCRKIYLENYTVNFPYSLKALEKEIGKKIIPAGREFVENMNELLGISQKQNACLLVYGSPLTATTHISLIEEMKKRKIKYEIIFNASVLDAVAETGLQLYKFGKTTSLPLWKENFRPDSFMDIVKTNQKINAHSLILIDIDLKFKDALNELIISARDKKFKIDRIIICSRLGNKDRKIYYGKIDELKNKEVKAPFCFIIPGKLHFVEEEILKSYE